jgi:hypothetical protein
VFSQPPVVGLRLTANNGYFFLFSPFVLHALRDSVTVNIFNEPITLMQSSVIICSIGRDMQHTIALSVCVCVLVCACVFV